MSTKKSKNFNIEMQIRGVNRRLFARSPIVRKKLEESRKEVPRYKKDGSLAKKPQVLRQCEVCGSWVPSTKISVDHIDPVVPPNGFPEHLDMWQRVNIFMQRLWCEESNLQRICDDCHAKKTYKEKIERLIVKYSKELEHIEQEFNNNLKNPEVLKALLVKVKRYCTKKSQGLESIKNKACDLRDRIKSAI